MVPGAPNVLGVIPRRRGSIIADAAERGATAMPALFP
jgi:hypothetical protein